MTYSTTDGGAAVRLTDGWTLSLAEGGDVPDDVRAALAAGGLPATVPGCVHTDLLAAGLIPDPYLDDNELRLGWIGHTDWAYETAFDWSGSGTGRVDLVFAGLDTVATVTLNGVEVGRTQNMHRGYRFDVSAVLRERDNRLRVRFGSAYRYAEGLRERLGELPNAYPEPFNFIRKMACNFGWDWGPTLVTAGIWRPVWLHEWSTARLAQVRPVVTVEGSTGRVDLHVELERAADGPVVLAASVPNGEREERSEAESRSASEGRLSAGESQPETAARVELAAGQREAVLTLTVPDARRWWPRGYGEQPRYPVELTLTDPDGRELDSWRRSVGFRTVRLDTTPDPAGTPFTVVVNDVPVFVRGVNWIPDDVFPTRVTRRRLATRLAQACEANVNFVRVWGGGLYESDDFYDLADELGLLVEQDFLFACAAYPEDEPLRSEVAAEARENVVRLAHHPSLVMWIGNNENIWGYHDWGWQERLAGRPWGAGYYLDLLPRIVAELDPTRPYWPGSPYSGRSDLHPNDPAHGSMHIWDVWNWVDYTGYREYRPRFVAEFGYQGPPTYATLRRALSDDPLAPDSSGMRHHQKAEDGDAKLSRGLRAHLPEPRDFDDWHYLTQLNQARAIALGVEYFRSLRPHCMGAVVWQLNDCWPVTSWAAVDGDARRKPLWYALRRIFADRLITVQPTDDGLALVGVNDGGDDWTAQLDVARVGLSGEPRAKTVVDLVVPARSAVHVPLPADLATADDPYTELLLARVAGGGAEPDGEPDGGRAWWFFAEDRELRYPAAEYDATVERGAGDAGADELRVTVTAKTLLRDLTLYPDRLSPAAATDRALVTLLPGESATFRVTGAAGIEPAALTARPVLRCVNDIPRQE